MCCNASHAVYDSCCQGTDNQQWDQHRLSSLVLAPLVDSHAASLAEALRTNRHLLRLDPAGPFITKKGITSDPLKYVAAR
jgi:hypothetical protein